jgi:hypothetical protein
MEVAMRSTKVCFVLFLFSTIFIFLIFACQKEEDNNALTGTWKMVSGSYIGPAIQVECNEEDRMCYKIISRDHFAVVQVCPANPDSMFFAAIGKYSMSDSTYVEEYEATNVSYKIGTSMTFKSTFEEDKNLWIVEAKDNEMELHEVWQRVQ